MAQILWLNRGHVQEQAWCITAFIYSWIIWQKIDRDVEFILRYLVLVLHHDPHVTEKNMATTEERKISHTESFCIIITKNYKTNYTVPWADGLGSCSAVELLYSDRKSCVDFLPAPVSAQKSFRKSHPNNINSNHIKLLLIFFFKIIIKS